MRWSGVFKILIGVTLAIAILLAMGVGAARYLITHLTAPPARPVFPNDSPSSGASPSAGSQASADQASSPTPTDETSPSPSGEASPEPSPAETALLAPGTYRARVTQAIGLVLRQEPSRDADPLGGLEYDEEIIVLETSPDGEWLHVRLDNGGAEGWIKSGNTEPVE